MPIEWFWCTCQEKWHLTFSKYCTCHEKWHACFILVTCETSFTMRGSPNVTLQQNHYPTSGRNSRKTATYSFPVRGRSDHDPRPFRDRSRQSATRRATEVAFRAQDEHFIEKYNISRSAYLCKINQILRLPRKVTLDLHQVLRLRRKVTLDLHQVLRLPRKVTLDLQQVLHLPGKVTLDLHQVLRLPRKVTRMLYTRHIWNVIYNARSTNPPNSPNTAPARQKHHPTSGRNLRKTATTSFPMRGRSDHDPRPFRDRSRQSATRRATEVAFRAQDEHFIEKYNISHSAYLSKIHQIMRLPRKVTLDLHQVLRLRRKVTLDLHKYCASNEKWHWTFTKHACHEKWHWTFTKYCTCHKKWHWTFTK